MAYAGVKDDIHIVPLMCPFNLFLGAKGAGSIWGRQRSKKMNGGIIRAGLGIYPSKGHLPPFGSGVIVKLKTSWRQLITQVNRKIGYKKNYDFTALLSTEC